MGRGFLNPIDPIGQAVETYLESTSSLLGYLGVDSFVNKMLNSIVDL